MKKIVICSPPPPKKRITPLFGCRLYNRNGVVWGVEGGERQRTTKKLLQY